MTELTKLLYDLDEIGENVLLLVDSDGNDFEKLLILENLRLNVLGDIAKKVDKFSKRLEERDPATGQRRYGETMRSKIIRLQDKYNAIVKQIPTIEAKIEQLRRAESQENVSKEIMSNIENQLTESITEYQRLADFEQTRMEEREAIYRAGLAENEQLRLSKEANAIREQKRAAEKKIADVRISRERAVQELLASIPTGSAGVDSGLKSIGEQLQNNPTKKLTVFSSLLQVLENVRLNPEDLRFRRIRCENELFKEDLGQFAGAMQVLIASGFTIVVEDDGDSLVMVEPDLSTSMDKWMQWYDTLKNTVDKLKDMTGSRDRISHGGAFEK